MTDFLLGCRQQDPRAPRVVEALPVSRGRLISECFDLLVLVVDGAGQIGQREIARCLGQVAGWLLPVRRLRQTRAGPA
jgi:hypothetical protein